MPRCFVPPLAQATIVAAVTMLGSVALLRTWPPPPGEVTLTSAGSGTVCPRQSPDAASTPPDTTPDEDGLAHLDPALEPSLASTAGPETSVEFRNRRTFPVKVYWLDYAGRRVLYETLAPGTEVSFVTYVGHPWVVTDEDDVARFVVMPSPTPGVVLVT